MINRAIPRAEELWARPECPEPGRWSAPDGIATESDVSTLLGGLVLALKPDIAVETGSYMGDTTEAIGLALKMIGRGRLFSVECDYGRASFVAGRVRALPVDVAYGSSLEVVVPSPIDFLFIDSEYDTRVEEIRRYAPLRSPRCVIVVHDTVIEDYRHKLEQLARERLVHRWIYLPTPRGLGITRYVD